MRGWRLALGLLLLSCDAPGKAPAAAPSPAPGGRYVDEAAGQAFVLPAGFVARAQHFPRDTPPHKLKDTYVVEGPAGAAVVVDVWLDPEGQPAAVWFERNLAFMRASGATVAAATFGANEGILVDQPRSPQATHRRAAIIAGGGRVARVTCLDADDAAALAAWERIVATLEVPP